MHGSAEHAGIQAERCIVTPVARIVLHAKRFTAYDRTANKLAANNDSIILFVDRRIRHIDKQVGYAARQCFCIDRVRPWTRPRFGVDGDSFARNRRIRVAVRFVTVRIRTGERRNLVANVYIGIENTDGRTA